MVLGDVLGRERLVREAHVHDRRRVPLRGGQVDEPALGEQVQAAPVGHVEALDVLPGPHRRDREVAQRRDVDLHVEVAGVGEDGSVLHHLEVLAPEDVLVARRRDEDVPQPAASAIGATRNPSMTA